MTFANSYFLWLLLVIPPGLLVFLWWSWRTRQRLLTQFIQARLLPGLTVGISARRQKVRLACLVMAVACLIVALARPQWGFDWQEVKLRGLDIVVAIDTSKSMLAEDITPNRLARAKLAALDLMQQAKSDRLGLVAFAGDAFLQCPLTIDDAAFRQSVEALDVNTIAQGGTALAAAIETAATAFKEGDNYKVLVLITDGEDHDSGALEAAQKAAKEGLRIYTIGIGTAEGELLRVKDDKGQADYVRNEHGEVVKSRLNETLLQEMAGATEGGFYLPLRGAKTIDTLYEQGLAKLPKTEHQEKFVRQYHERYHWPLALGIALILVEMLFPERKREPKAKVAGLSTASGPVRAAVRFLLLSLILPIASSASPSSALREYNAGKYEEALKEYERLLQKKSEDPRLHFNAGAAAYRDQKLEEATKQFNEALATPDLKLQQQSYFNRGNTLYWLGAADADPAKRKESWEKALKDFESAGKLNREDPDAKYNYEFVKQKLEELKQQQQQSKQDRQDQNKDQKQDQDQQQQQSQQDKSEQQKNQDQQQQPKKEEQKDQGGKDQQEKSQQDAAQKEQQGEQKKQQEQKQAQQQDQQQAKQSSSQPKEKSEEEKEQEAGAAQAASQMTQKQARQLLDAQKREEQLLPAKPTGKPQDRARSRKDW